MKAHIAEGAIGELLAHIRAQLENATAVAKAAEACAVAGSPDQAVTIAHDIEQPIYEANTLLNAVSLIRRIAAED
jgi:hypothetical protein